MLVKFEVPNFNRFGAVSFWMVTWERRFDPLCPLCEEELINSIVSTNWENAASLRIDEGIFTLGFHFLWVKTESLVYTLLQFAKTSKRFH